MAATFISSATAYANAVGPTVTVPAGAVGDLLVALVFSDNDGNLAAMTAPSGWLEVASGGFGNPGGPGFGKVFVRISTAGDAGSYLFPASASSANYGNIQRFREWDTTQQFAAGPTFSTVAAGSTTSFIAPSITLTRPGALVCGWMEEGVTSGATITPPGGMTGTSTADSIPFLVDLVAYTTGISVGATGTRTATGNQAGGTSAQGYLTVSYAIADDNQDRYAGWFLGPPRIGGGFWDPPPPAFQVDSEVVAITTVLADAVLAVATIPVVVVTIVLAPTTVAGVASIPAITFVSDVLVTPTVVAGVASIPSVTVTTGSVVSVTVVASVVTIPASTVNVGSIVSATVVAAVASIPAVTVNVGLIVSVAVVAGVTTIPTPTVDTSGNALITGTVVAAATTIPTPTVLTGSVVSATAVAGVTTIPSPTVSAGSGATPAPSTVAAVASIPASLITPANPTTVLAVATILAPAVSTGSTVSATTVAAVATIPASDVITGLTVTAIVVTGTASIPSPSLQGSAVASVTVVPASTTIPVVTVLTASGSFIVAVTVLARARIPAPAGVTFEDTSTPVPPAQPGGWYSLLSIRAEQIEAARQQLTYDARPAACPSCGEPLRAGPHGGLYCPWGDFDLGLPNPIQ